MRPLQRFAAFVYIQAYVCRFRPFSRLFNFLYFHSLALSPFSTSKHIWNAHIQLGYYVQQQQKQNLHLVSINKLLTFSPREQKQKLIITNPRTHTHFVRPSKRTNKQTNKKTKRIWNFAHFQMNCSHIIIL